MRCPCLKAPHLPYRGKLLADVVGRSCPRALPPIMRALLRCGLALLAIVLGLQLSSICLQAQVVDQLADTPEGDEQWNRVLFEGTIDQRRQAAIATRECGVELQGKLLGSFIELLRHEKDGQIRLAVLETLTQMGPAAADAAPALAYAMLESFGGRRNEELHQDYRAALALASIGAPAVENLRNLLRAERDNIRAEAAMAIGRIGSSAAAATPELIQLLSDDSQRVRHDASIALAQIGAPAVQPLLEAMQHQQPATRAAAAAALGAMHPLPPEDRTQIQQILAAALEDPDADVRSAAVAALPALDLPRETLQQHLMARMLDAEKSVRTAVINVFTQHPELLNGLEKELAAHALNPQQEIAWQAIFLLHTRGPDAANSLLEIARQERSHLELLARGLASMGAELTERLQLALDDSNERVRICAALALGQMRPVTGETLRKLPGCLAVQQEDLQVLAVQAIASLEFRAEPVVPAIRTLIGHANPKVREQVVGILFAAAPHDTQLVQDLTPMLSDSDPTVQRRVIEALKSMGPIAQSAIPEVIQQLNSPEAEVQRAAAEMIASHGAAAASAVPKLVELLRHSTDDSVVVLATTLGQLGETAQTAYPDLAVHLNSQSPQVRAAIIGTLASLRLPPDQVKSHYLAGLRDPDETVRQQASSAFRRLGDEAAGLIPDLILLAADEQTGESIRRLLGRLERNVVAPDLIPRLEALLEDENNSVKQNAIRFLGLAGPAAKSLLPQLEALSMHPDEGLRQEAQQAVERIRGNAASVSDAAGS